MNAKLQQISKKTHLFIRKKCDITEQFAHFNIYFAHHSEFYC